MEDLTHFSWYIEEASRPDAENFLARCEPGRFIVRKASMPGRLALSHKLPTGEIGHALIASGPSGWTITGSDKAFSTVEALLRSRTLTFPKPGEDGAPGQPTFADTSSGGRVASAINVVTRAVALDGAPIGSTGAPLPVHSAGVGVGSGTMRGVSSTAVSSTASRIPTTVAPVATTSAVTTLEPVTPIAPPPFPVTEAMEKVLACLVNPNMHTLELFSTNLTYLPNEVNDLQHLQSLYLSNNLFSEFPKEICSLVNLKTLWLQSNELTKLPKAIARLTQLEKLKLSANKIDAKTGFPVEMAQMTSLREIWLENNQLSCFPPALLGVTSIHRIWLDQNKITEIPPTIALLAELERLSMTKNLLREVPPEIGDCANLERLVLNDNEIVTVSTELNRCLKLHTLSLANNRIVQAPSLHLPNLVDIVLENNPCYVPDMEGGINTALATSSVAVASSTVRAGSSDFGTTRGPAADMVNGAKAPPKKSDSFFKFPGLSSKKSVEDVQQAFFAAIAANDDKRVKDMMKKRKKGGIDLAALNAEGLTPLTLAVKEGHDDVVAAIVGSRELLKDEINLRDKFGYTPLHWAVRGTNDAILHRLLKCPGIDVALQNDDQNTPLHYFCEKNNSPDCERIGQTLIDKGAVVNKTNNNGESPLHKAIFNNSVRLMMVRLLIRNGADVNVLTLQRQSPLQYAVRLQREDLVSMLLKAGAKLDLRSTDGMTAYEVAVKEKCDKIAQLLSECQRLQKWLQQLELLQYFPMFVNEDIFYAQLADLRESDLDRLGITTTGHRLKITKACQMLRDERNLNTIAQREKQLELEQPPIFASNAKQAESNWLAELTAGMDLRENEHIAFGDIELLEELGSGAAGKVYKGLYKGKNVAVKVLKELKDGGEIEDFKKELEIMTSIRDPHMVFFFGVCLKPKMCMVMELCARKSLFHVLNKEGLKIGWTQALEWGAQAAAGTACLHKHDIVHRDLKSLNLLVTENWIIKVADFGLARFNNDGNLETLNKMRGTMAYCPPEAYFAQPFNYKSDVYSLAVILWELVNRCIKLKYEAPFSEYKNLTMDFQIIIQVAKSNLRPTIPPTCPAEVRALIETCWTHKRDERPDAADVQTRLRELIAIYENNTADWDSRIKK